MAFFGATLNFTIQKLKSKHLVCLSFLWWQVCLRGREQFLVKVKVNQNHIFSTDSWNFEILVCNRFQIFMNHNKNNILFYLLHIISVKLSFLEIFWCFQDIDFGFGLKRNFWYIACNLKNWIFLNLNTWKYQIYFFILIASL